MEIWSWWMPWGNTVRSLSNVVMPYYGYAEPRTEEKLVLVSQFAKLVANLMEIAGVDRLLLTIGLLLLRSNKHSEPFDGSAFDCWLFEASDQLVATMWLSAQEPRWCQPCKLAAILELQLRLSTNVAALTRWIPVKSWISLVRWKVRPQHLQSGWYSWYRPGTICHAADL